MSIPILRQGHVLLAVVQAAVSDEELMEFQDELLAKVSRFKSQGVLVDVTVLDVIDSFAARTLRTIAHAVQLCGARVIIAGIQPEVAFAMTQLGLTLEGIITVLDLDEGLALLEESRG